MRLASLRTRDQDPQIYRMERVEQKRRKRWWEGETYIRSARPDASGKSIRPAGDVDHVPARRHAGRRAAKSTPTAEGRSRQGAPHAAAAAARRPSFNLARAERRGSVRRDAPCTIGGAPKSSIGVLALPERLQSQPVPFRWVSANQHLRSGSRPCAAVPGGLAGDAFVAD